MATVATINPSQRQMLVNVGNRYVIFGPTTTMPQPAQFDPEIDSEMLPRVADESEVAEERIAQTLRVPGMKTSPAIEERQQADLVLSDDAGNRILVDIKVRERDPKARDFEQGQRRLAQAASIGQRLEIWFFNIEKLKLRIMHLDDSDLRIDELIPIDVWERTSEGIFTRTQVIEEVEDWVCRVSALYDDIRAWLGNRRDLHFEQSRAVTMSEEMMQEFAVTDRDIPVLDVLNVDQVIASFVPRGLWMIGSWGRIDVITRNGTQMLIALGGPGNREWQLVSASDRRRTDKFDKDALLALVAPP